MKAIKIICKPFAWALSWMFFLVGHAWSIALSEAIEAIEDTEENFVEFLYNRYNNSMHYSFRIQEWAGNKTPWGEPGSGSGCTDCSCDQ